MKDLKNRSFVIVFCLVSQCNMLVVPDISGYIATLIGLLPKPTQSSIQVTVSGLTGTGLVLQNNGADDLSIPANGSYSFSAKIATSASYSVTVLTQPTNPSQTCIVSGGTGIVISGDVTSITVNCSTTTFTLGGNVAGYTSTGLVLANSDGQTQSITTNGSFAFATTYTSGTSYNVTIQTQPAGNACTISNNTGTVTANITTITVTCSPINTLYVLNMQTQQIRAYTANADGTLTLLNTYATGIASAVILLWNGKHVVIGGLNDLKSFLRNADGSLTAASTFTTVNGVYSGGTPNFLPSGKFFYVNDLNNNFLKFEIDTNGIFSGETLYSVGCYVYQAPIHPTGNYIITFNTGCGQSQDFFPITNTTTGALGVSVSNSPQISAPVFFPEQADCAYSPNGNFLYCADSGQVGVKSGGNIKQMSINSTTLAPLSPFNVNPETPSNYFGPKSVIVHPNGNFLFVYGNTNVFSYNLDPVTGLIGSQITSIASPNSCGTSSNQVTKLQLNSTGTYLYSICNNSGDVGSYPVSASGVISAPVIYTTAGSTGGQTLLYVTGI